MALSATNPDRAPRVLVVEDDSSVRMLLEMELGDLGYEVASASAPREAIAMLERAVFDVVLTDIRMPDMDGIALTRWVRERQPRTQVVLMTGFASLETAAEAVRLGAADYLLKPFRSIKQVQHCLDRAIEAQRMKDETEALRRQLEHADRLAVMGQLASSVAHEINNPACAILANLSTAIEILEDLAAMQKVDPAAQAMVAELGEIAQECTGSVERIRGITRDLRTYARFDDGGVGLTRLDEVVQVALNLARVHLRHRARVVTRLDEVPPVPADTGALTQVALNLLVNAAEAIPVDRGSPGEIVVIARRAPGGVQLVVEDDGVGMSAETLERIFDPSFSTKSHGSFTGLGLALCREMIEDHRGHITATATLGQGSRFEIFLPHDTGKSIEDLWGSDLALTELGPSVVRGRRLLIVDDERSVGRAAARVLTDAFEVTVVTGGIEARELLGSGAGFDLVLCDLMMPDLSGMALYRWVEQARPELTSRFCFMTGGAIGEEMNRFSESQSYRLLRKPFDADSLLSFALGRVDDPA